MPSPPGKRGAALPAPDSPGADAWLEIETAVIHAIRKHDVVTATACVDALTSVVADSQTAGRKVVARLCVFLERMRHEAQRCYGLGASQLPRPEVIAARLGDAVAIPQLLESFAAIAYEILHACEGDRQTAIAASARCYLDQRFSEAGTSVNSTAAELRCSVGHLTQTFRTAYGVPPGMYLQNRRIEMAKDLLQDPERSVKEVASQCGYSSPDSFRRAFKAATGLTPSEFRLKAPSAVSRTRKPRESTDASDISSDV